MKNLIKSIFLFFLLALVSCGGKEKKEKENITIGGYDKKEVETTPAAKAPEEAVINMDDKGIGPVKEVDLPATIDQSMAAEGQALYKAQCMACHRPTKKFIGPAPLGVLERRSPEWVMNMILNPSQMVKEDPIAKQLLIEFNGSPMADQNLTQEEARKILEYFRTLK